MPMRFDNSEVTLTAWNGNLKLSFPRGIMFDAGMSSKEQVAVEMVPGKVYFISATYTRT